MGRKQKSYFFANGEMYDEETHRLHVLSDRVPDEELKSLQITFDILLKLDRGSQGTRRIILMNPDE